MSRVADIVSVAPTDKAYVSVTSAAFGNGQLVDYAEQTTTVRLLNAGNQSVEYQVDAGPWKRLEYRNTDDLAIDMSAVSIHLRLAEFSAGPVPVELWVEMPPAGVFVDGEPFDELEDGTSGSTSWLKQNAADVESMFTGAITRNADGAPTSANVVWPDGTTGVYAATTLSTTSPGAVDAYSITYNTKTVQQPAVTRDATTGLITNRPAITVT